MLKTEIVKWSLLKVSYKWAKLLCSIENSCVYINFTVYIGMLFFVDSK